MGEMTVDICSQCHPFYTGKQKLVDTAGRVDRFKAAREKAEAKKEALVKKGQKALSKSEAAAMLQADAEIKADNTTEIKKPDVKAAKVEAKNAEAEQEAKQKDQNTDDK